MAGDIEKRKLEFKRLNQPHLAPPEKIKHYEKCRERCIRVISKDGDKTFNLLPQDVQTFPKFCSNVRAWDSSETSYVFHRDDSRVKTKDVLCQRSQLSGLCYIHGPDMLQHYLVSINTETSAPMIDISKMIRESFNAIELERHIFNDEGGNSRDMLELILEPDSIIVAAGLVNIEENLKKYGPLLVSRFQVFQDFHNANSSAYHGNPDGKSKGHHAMIIIGARTEKGKNYYLLQNWWKKMQFVEVDEVYLKSCSPTLYYVETPQMKIPENFATDRVRYAENENLDKPESMSEIEGPLKDFNYHYPYIHVGEKKKLKKKLF